jgi:archaemetzincin
LSPPFEHTIIVSPSVDLEIELLENICSAIHSTFRYKTEIIPLLGELDFAFDSERSQYHSTAILKRLASLAPLHAVKVIAITSEDLFIPIMSYVHGEAQLGGKACIISINRLKENPSLANNLDRYRNRLIKESIHELGHTFSLRHCKDEACIMHYSRTVRDVDNKGMAFCRYCRVLLEDELNRLPETDPSARAG